MTAREDAIRRINDDLRNGRLVIGWDPGKREREFLAIKWKEVGMSLGEFAPLRPLVHLHDGRRTPACRAKAAVVVLLEHDEFTDQCETKRCSTCHRIVTMREREGRYGTTFMIEDVGPSAAAAAPSPRLRLTIGCQGDWEP